ncbi:MAG TPA: hypothetical protein VGB15_18235 [Longimicrobium sp.]|jgi:hypothetical protein
MAAIRRLANTSISDAFRGSAKAFPRSGVGGWFDLVDEPRGYCRIWAPLGRRRRLKPQQQLREASQTARGSSVAVRPLLHDAAAAVREGGLPEVPAAGFNRRMKPADEPADENGG